VADYAREHKLARRFSVKLALEAGTKKNMLRPRKPPPQQGIRPPRL
jgi:hypothetical protein